MNKQEEGRKNERVKNKLVSVVATATAKSK